MIALVLSIIFSVGFGHVMKWAEHRRANTLWVGAWNYISASVACALFMLVARPTGEIAFTISTGIWGGVCYLISLLYYFSAVRRLGVGLATAAIRVSVALPVVLALVVWHEALHPVQLAGLLLVGLALPLLGSGRAGSPSGGMAMVVGLLIPLFVITGLGQLAARVYSSGAPSSNYFLYLTFLFAGAAAAALVVLRVRPVPLHRQDVAMGLLLGGVNVASNVSLLAALRVLPSAVVFAVSSSAGVALAALSGMILWRERLSRRAAGGVALATAAVVLLTR